MGAGYRPDWAALALLLGLCSSSCGQDFDPFNEVFDFRLLGIRADPPELRPGEVARLDALVESQGAPVAYRWSWCPYTAGSDQSFECIVDQAQLQALADAQLGQGVVEVPSLELGTSTTASLPFDFDPRLAAGLCESLRGLDIPDFVELPECDGTLTISLRLEISSGGERITGLKELDLDYAPTERPANRNPTIREIYATRPDDDARALSAPLGTVALSRGFEYLLQLDVPEDSAEVDGEGERERLVVTWFIGAGETDKGRTSLQNGDFQSLSENLWTTPRQAVFEDPIVPIYLVVRDGRGGLGWIRRDVTLRDEP